MRMFYSTLVFVLLLVRCFAQQNEFPLAPADLVQHGKNQGYIFENAHLFVPLSAQQAPDGELKNRLNDYQLLRLEPQGLRLFQQRMPVATTFAVPAAAGNTIELELVQVNLFSDDFQVLESHSTAPVEIAHGLHYRGVVKGDPNSFAAVSIFNDRVMGLISSPSLGNLVLGKLEEPGYDYQHVLYNDREVLGFEDFLCGTPDATGPGYHAHDLEPPLDFRNDEKCVRIYFEVDYDIFQNKGGTNGATDYVTGIFNQVAALYTKDNMKLIVSQIFVWTNPSPYSGTSSSQLLSQFQQYRTNFNGDLAQLLSYKASGGIAVLNGLCHPYTAGKMSFSSINTTYNNVPTYSFTVMVVAHELGHLLGSHHTHACVWNGNNTAIDGCAGFTEGNCALPGIPSGGGTIMSYCHITSTGINFNLGFGTQPTNVMRNRIAAAACVQTCTTGGGGGGGGNGGGGGGGNPPVSNCTQNQVILRLVLDNYGPETTWRLKNAAGNILKSGGPYQKGVAGTIVRDTFCLPNGCYNFEILDEYGDGICCNFGNGSYSLVGADGKTIASGGAFQFSEVTNFCVPNTGNASCINIDFKNYAIRPYGAGQDMGTFQLLNNGTELKIQDNAWKTIMLNYTVTPNTVLDFEFGSTIRGEIHGIGFDNDDNISANYTFKLYGTQAWGIQNYNNYPGNNTWRRYVIPVGQFYTGQFNRLFFAADHDDPPRNGNSFYRRIRIYEGSSCQALNESDDELKINTLAAFNQEAMPSNLTVYPNPTSEQLTLRFRCKETGDALIQVFNMMGQKVKTLPVGVSEGYNTERIWVSDLPAGAYIIRIDTGVNQLVSQFNVSR